MLALCDPAFPIASDNPVAYALTQQGECMAINWFEGGRRITKLIGGAVALGGLLYVVIDNRTDYVTFETDSPDTPWAYTTAYCDYPDRSQTIENGIFLKRSMDVQLCFRETEGSLLYKFAGYQEDQQKPNNVRVPPRVGGPAKTPLYYQADSYSAEATAYMLERKDNFVLTPQMRAAASDQQWKKSWIARWDRFGEAFKWVAGINFGLIVITFAIGWIVRGFAGIPTGRDFKPKAD